MFVLYEFNVCNFNKYCEVLNLNRLWDESVENTQRVGGLGILDPRVPIYTYI